MARLIDLLTEGDACQLHELKSLPEFFEKVLTGDKNFEIRRDDRGYRVGDILRLKEWMPSGGYTGRECDRVVTHLTDFEQREGFVVMGMRADIETEMAWVKQRVDRICASTRRIAQEARDRLTPREREVLDRMINERNNEEQT